MISYSLIFVNLLYVMVNPQLMMSALLRFLVTQHLTGLYSLVLFIN